jgi:hypothetical protein
MLGGRRTTFKTTVTKLTGSSTPVPGEWGGDIGQSSA